MGGPDVDVQGQLDRFADAGFVTLHDETTGKVVNIVDPSRPGKAAVGLFDAFPAAVPLLLHLASSDNRHGDVLTLTRWDGADLPSVVASIVGDDRSVVLFDVDGWTSVPPDGLEARTLALAWAAAGSPEPVSHRVDGRFDLVAAEWVGVPVR